MIAKGSLNDLNGSYFLAERMMRLGDFARLAGFHYRLIVFLVFLSQFLGEEIKIRFAENLLKGAVVMPAILLVGESKPSLQILAKHVLRHGFHQGMVEGLGTAQGFLHLASMGDVLNRALVVKQITIPVAHSPAVLRNPDDAAILAKNLGFETAQRVVGLHEPDKFLTATRFNIQAAGNILDVRHQIHRRAVTIDSGQRDISEEIMAVNRRAEDAFNQVVKNSVIIFLFIDQGEALQLTGGGGKNRSTQLLTVQFRAAKIFLGAAVDDFRKKTVILVRPDGEHGEAGGTRGQPGDLKQGGRVGLGNLEEHRQESVHRGQGESSINGWGHHDANRVQQINDGAGKGLIAANQQYFLRASKGVDFHSMSGGTKIQCLRAGASALSRGKGFNFPRRGCPLKLSRSSHAECLHKNLRLPDE